MLRRCYKLLSAKDEFLLRSLIASFVHMEAIFTAVTAHLPTNDRQIGLFALTKWMKYAKETALNEPD